MHRINKINVVERDNATGAIIKLIHTTAGEPFFSRCSAYNQTYERLEQTIKNNHGNSFEKAPPLKIHTLSYLVKPHPKDRTPTIKELTKSRLLNDPVHDPIFYNEVQNIKKLSLTSTRVVLYFFQISVDDWDNYTLEDIETLICLQQEAQIPHITILTHPYESYAKNKILMDKYLKELSPEQTAFGQFHPSMKKKEGKRIMQYFFMEGKIMGLIMVGLAANQTSNAYYYSMCFNEAPQGKLMCVADMADTLGHSPNQRIAAAQAFRRFGFDITCRKVTFNRTGFNFPTPSEKNLIYDDTTGGMLPESTQILWHGKSAVDFIMDNFPANTGLSFREYVLAFNFVELNRTGLKEAQHIIQKSHMSYIHSRIYVQAFYGIP